MIPEHATNKLIQSELTVNTKSFVGYRYEENNVNSVLKPTKGLMGSLDIEAATEDVGFVKAVLDANTFTNLSKGIVWEISARIGVLVGSGTLLGDRFRFNHTPGFQSFGQRQEDPTTTPGQYGVKGDLLGYTSFAQCT
jgi:outer membrane protein assembly factor BamA